jgi:hypothetical protein
VSAMLLFHADASAQERGIELQAGAGYVRDSGEGPSVPAVNAGVVAWLTSGWGVGVRVTKGLGDEHFDPVVDGGDRIFLGPADLPAWAVTSQWRGFAGGTEVNAGVGFGGHGYRYEEILTGIRRGDAEGGRIDPTPPRFVRLRSGTGFIALDLLIGRRLRGPLHVKGGFTYGLAGDLHPFQPLVMLVWKPQ